LFAPQHIFGEPIHAAHPHLRADRMSLLFEKAVARLVHYTWQREVDFNEKNTTGVVDFDKYCAKAGEIVHKQDTQYCCARSANKLGTLEPHPDKDNARRCNRVK
jgi:hypothetical protein